MFDNIDANKDVRTEVYASLDIRFGRKHKPATLKVKVDTGAQGNVLPLRIYRQMCPENLDTEGYPQPRSLKTCSTVLTAYNGERIIQYGTMRLPCTHRDAKCDAEFYVADTPGPAIMGLPSCRALQLVTMHCEISSNEHDSAITTKEDLRKIYPDRFKGIGNFDGEFYITTDLNVTPHYRTPTLDEVTHKLAGAKIFSKLDARHGYWSVSLDDESSLKTTFNSPFGRFCFTRLPFGLNLSQDVFQERMDNILEHCTGTMSIADDVGVFGKDEAEHDANLHNLMKTARRHGLVFNIDKCEIKRQSLKLFGLVFDAEGAHPDPKRIRDIEQMRRPVNSTELQEFLGIATYMSPFLPKLSQQTAPLRDLLKKEAEFEWTPSHDAVFEDRKASICRHVTLSYFRPEVDSVVQVDASSRGLGAVLLQNGKPIAFASKTLSDCEQRYANIERDMLAVVFGCERFHTYLFGKRFLVQSDQKPLEMIHRKNLAAAPQRLQRMLLRLQPYDFELRYKPGKEMALADTMSRQPCRDKEQIEHHHRWMARASKFPTSDTATILVMSR